MDIHYPDWKTLTLRQFHMAGPRPGVLEGRLRVINARAAARAEALARKVFEPPGDLGDAPLPFHLSLPPGFDPAAMRLPRRLFFALFTAPPLGEGEDVLFSCAVVAWFANEAAGALDDMIRAHVRPFDWNAVARDATVAW